MNTPVSFKQRRIILKCYHVPYVYDEFGKTDRAICDDLCNEGLLINNGGFVTTTERGKALIQSNFSTWI